MNMTEIKTTAKGLGIQVRKMRKGDLIRAIQSKEGNFPCFETAKEYCSQKACRWRESCLPVKKKSMQAWEKEKNTYAKKVTTRLKALKKQLAELEKKGQKMMGQGKKEALADIKKFAEKIAALQKNSENLVAASEDAWKIAKKGVDDALDDLSKVFKKAAKKFK
ncbi:MAG: hypothetical protein PF442_00070 [Desulfobulbaceae bacterium]|jgi:chromosome segregation ATPase|nr:hypothetical protein [Desulfobulbaceae bacterium]